MKMTVFVDENDIGLLTSGCRCSDNRASDELLDHIYTVLEALLPDRVIYDGIANFNGTMQELDTLLIERLQKPVTLVCHNASEDYEILE